jgi:cytochrome P450
LRPPGPKNPPVLGHYPAFRKDAPGFLLKTAREYGDIAYFKLGKQNIYEFSDPDLIKDVLVTSQHGFIKSRILQRARILLGDGLLTSEAPLHTRQRRLVQPAFHRDRLAAYAETMVAYAARTRDSWQDRQSFDAAREMANLTLSIVAKTLFNADVDAESGDIREALTAILHLFHIVMLPFSEWLEKLPLPQMRRFERARTRLDETIYRIIDERRASGRDAGDLLSTLLTSVDEEGGGMTNEQVRDETLTLFLAGHETTANALTWTWYLLSQHPEVERRFHDQIDCVLGGRPPAPADVPTLRYVEMVFAEAIRLYPPGWAIGRMAKTGYEAAGYRIQPGEVVLMSPYVVHRDPRYFPDPERFDPERWTPEARSLRPRFSYFPFGGGARVCVGEHFAWMEGVLLLAVLGQKWRLRLAPGHPVEHRALITLRPRYGMQMIAERRVQ